MGVVFFALLLSRPRLGAGGPGIHAYIGFKFQFLFVEVPGRLKPGSKDLSFRGSQTSSVLGQFGGLTGQAIRCRQAAPAQLKRIRSKGRQ